MRQQWNSRWRMFLGCCGFIGLLLSIAAQAEAAVTTIPPSPPSGAVTVSLFQQDATGALVDVTNNYLPRVGEVVYVAMSDGSTPMLVGHWPTGPVSPSSLTFPFDAAELALLNPYLANKTTSAYKGEATNYPSVRDIDSPLSIVDDFEFVPGGSVLIGSYTAHKFKALDNGGMLVVQGNGTGPKFIIPKDSNADGIPDSWFNAYLASLTAACQGSEADCEPGPGGNTAVGDGISNFDEYRGFIISGQHVRTDPRVKNLFVHVVTPQCGATSYLGTLVPTDTLLNNVDTLITGTRVSSLGAVGGVFSTNTSEWVDHFVSYSEETKLITFNPVGPDGLVSDRRVNQHAVYPIADTAAPAAQKYFQKGLRVIECLDGTMPAAADLDKTVMGVAGNGTPNSSTNAFIYTQRIINWVNAKCTGSCLTSPNPKLSTYVNGAWEAPATYNLDIIKTKMIQYIVAMEVGHSVRLTPTVEVVRKTSYGYHHAPGTGTNMDMQAIFSSSTFNIPSLFSVPDQSAFKVRN